MVDEDDADDLLEHGFTTTEKVTGLEKHDPPASITMNINETIVSEFQKRVAELLQLPLTHIEPPSILRYFIVSFISQVKNYSSFFLVL